VNAVWVNDVTERELEVLAAYCQAQGTKGAADRLGLSKHTIRNTLANVRSRLGVTTTASAVYLLRARLP
jgi:DNA-binding NarL/FixJ family response regulator